MTRMLAFFTLVICFALTWTSTATAQERCPSSKAGTLGAATATTHPGRLSAGQPSTCAAQQTAPNVQQANSTFHYDAYTLRNRSTAAQCVTVTLATSSGMAQSAAYLGSFNPADIQQNFLGYTGSNANNNPVTYMFNVPALATFVVIASEVNNAGATYTLDITGCGTVVATSVTPNAGPSTGGTPVTIKGSGFLAGVGVKFGADDAADVTLVDEATITATTPAHADGLADVVVTNLDATTSTLTNAFTFVAPTDTTIELSSTPNPAVFGQSVTFTAKLSSASGTPVGSVTFLDGATSLGTSAISGTGVATLAKALAVGNHPITVTYAGDATFAAGTSAVLEQVVGVAMTATTLVSSANPSADGEKVTFTATVTAVAPGVGIPTGNVIFMSDGVSIGSGPVDATGKVSVTTSFLAVGTHVIDASYNGDTGFTTSVSPQLSQVITALADAGTSGGTSGTSGGTSGTSGTSGGTSGTSGGVDAGVNAAPGDETGGGGCDCRQAGGGSMGLSAILGVLVALAFLSRRSSRAKG